MSAARVASRTLDAAALLSRVIRANAGIQAVGSDERPEFQARTPEPAALRSTKADARLRVHDNVGSRAAIATGIVERQS